MKKWKIDPIRLKCGPHLKKKKKQPSPPIDHMAPDAEAPQTKEASTSQKDAPKVLFPVYSSLHQAR